jgi:hypothetical protein
MWFGRYVSVFRRIALLVPPRQKKIVSRNYGTSCPRIRSFATMQLARHTDIVRFDLDVETDVKFAIRGLNWRTA